MLLSTPLESLSALEWNDASPEPEPVSPLARQILEVVYEIRNVIDCPTDIPPRGTDGDAYQLERLSRLIDRRQPIHFVVPAFPAKSPNPEKTLGSLPDYGEVLALSRLNDMCLRIGRMYSGKAFVTICSDGRVFSDLIQVADRSVDEYGWAVRGIIADYRLDCLRTFNLDDLFGDYPSYEEMRQRLVRDYAEPLEQLRDRVKRDPESLQLFNGIHRFLFEDMLALESGNPSCSRNRIRNSTKQLAYAVIQRSNAWSRLVEQQFPDAMRLSIHPQPASSRKIGIRLLPSTDIWRTPWHSVLLVDGTNYSLVTRKHAEASGATLAYANGKYPYYVAPNCMEKRNSYVAA